MISAGEERPVGPGGWQLATVLASRPETASARTFRLRLERPLHQQAGQHVVVRLTAEDGYQASRSYSIASAPDDSPEIDLTVERLDGGEVSGFLHDVVEPGDVLEVRGPVGGWFVWADWRPVLLIGGGSGIVPLMSMLRRARRAGREDLVRLLVSVRTPGDLYYPAELPGPRTRVVYSRQAPAGSGRPAGRLTAADLDGLVIADATVYVCGSPGFADAAADLVIDEGVPAGRIRVERFGPSG